MKKLLIYLIVLCLANLLFGTTYYLDVTSGNDTDSGLTEALAWQTFIKTCKSVTSGDTVYVKGSAAYTLADSNDVVVDVNKASSATTSITFVGYYSTIYDGGIVEVNSATTTNTYCLYSSYTTLNYKFMNFRFTGATSHGAYFVGANANVIFINCEFDHNGGDGVNGLIGVNLINCLLRNNGGDGLQATTTCDLEDSIFFSNGLTGATLTTGPIVKGCLFAENLGDQLSVSGGTPLFIDHCTFDGNDVANSDGIYNAGTPTNTSITNCIFYDCANGVNFAAARTYRIDRNNCYYSCGAANTNWPDPTNTDSALRQDWTAISDPFISTGSIIAYIPVANAPTTGAKYGAIDSAHCANFWNSYAGGTNPPTGAIVSSGYSDGGAKQRVDPAGGTTTNNYYLIDSKTGGKQ